MTIKATLAGACILVSICFILPLAECSSLINSTTVLPAGEEVGNRDQKCEFLLVVEKTVDNYETFCY